MQKKDRCGEDDGHGKRAGKSKPQNAPYAGRLFRARIVTCKGHGRKMHGIDGGENKVFKIGGSRVSVDDGLIVVALYHKRVVDAQDRGLDQNIGKRKQGGLNTRGDADVKDLNERFFVKAKLFEAEAARTAIAV